MQQVTGDVIDSTYDTTLVHKSGAESITGTKDFAAGGITQGGAAIPRMVQSTAVATIVMRYEYNLETGEMTEYDDLPPSPQADQPVVEAPEEYRPFSLH